MRSPPTVRSRKTRGARRRKDMHYITGRRPQDHRTPPRHVVLQCRPRPQPVAEAIGKQPQRSTMRRVPVRHPAAFDSPPASPISRLKASITCSSATPVRRPPTPLKIALAYHQTNARAPAPA